MQQEVQRSKVWQLKAFDFTFTNACEVLLDAFRCHFTHQYRIELFAQSNQSNICRITLVTRAGVGKLC